MYFSEVTLFSQDIRDQGLRKRIVEMNHPRRGEPFLRRKRRQLKKAWNKLVSDGDQFKLHIDDVVLSKEPSRDMLNRAFGLLAVCRR